MAARRDGSTPVAETPRETEDEDWITLTEGMDAYERFRFIARHVLRAAIGEARTYATDERIFTDVEDRDALEDHLNEIDRQLREDGSLGDAERAFLCAAVAKAMEEIEMEAGCPWRELVRLAAADPDPRQGTELSEL